ncbi:PI-PLC X domain-containing protein 3-like [Rhopilema esculentum]|uniref:PI-PLC X domain-containing protein 3-like n=1 Tax=Rhopilema esculentum TaxID=499914 RepID=UPI0031D0D5C7
MPEIVLHNIKTLHFCWLLAIFCCYSAIKGSTAIGRNADWMARLPKELVNLPLRGIAIPGSHDSASYSLNSTNDLAPDIPKKVLNVMNLSRGYKGAEQYLRSEIYRWSITQRLDITQQLELGIRYFDLRVFYKEGEDRLYTYHGLIGAPIEEILLQMANFLDNYPREVLLLDFNHLEKEYNFSRKANKKLTNLLKTTFGEKIFTNKSTQASLSTLWSDGKNIIVFYRSPEEDFSGIVPEFVMTEKSLLSPFDKGKFSSQKSWLEFIENGYEHRPTSRTFYVTQGIMQPSILSIAASGLFGSGSLEKWTSDDATRSLVRWLHRCRRGVDGINIVIADFVENHNFTEAVLSLNLNNSSSDVYKNSLLKYITLVIVSVFISLN